MERTPCQNMEGCPVRNCPTEDRLIVESSADVTSIATVFGNKAIRCATTAKTPAIGPFGTMSKIDSNPIGWYVKAFLRCHSTKSKTRINKLNVDPPSSAVPHNAIPDVVYNNGSDRSAVRDLLSLHCPPTIGGLIVSVIIYPVNSVLRSRLLPHVGKKIKKSISLPPPPSADFYTSTTIPIVSPVFRLITPSYHRSPGVIFRLMNRVATMSIVWVEIALVVHVWIIRRCRSLVNNMHLNRRLRCQNTA